MAHTILRRLRYDTETAQQTAELVRRHVFPLPQSERAARRLLAQSGPRTVKKLLRLHRADRLGKLTEPAAGIEAQTRAAETLIESILQKEACFSLRQLAISGSDLMELGIPQGRRIGRILQALLERVIGGGLPNRKDILLATARDFAQETEKNQK